MKNAKAVFWKQTKSILRMPMLIVMPAAYLLLSMLFWLFAGGPVSDFTNLFAFMIVGMQMVSSTTAYIIEDRSTMNLRFMSMAGVKSREYSAGTFAALMLVSMGIMVLYAVAGVGLSPEFFLFIGFAWFACAVSILVGLMMGLSKYPLISTPIGLLLGFGPMLAGMNESMERVFRFAYTNQLRLVMDYLSNRRREEEIEETAEHICPTCGEIVLCIAEYENDYGYDAAARIISPIGGGIMSEALIVSLINAAIVGAFFIWMQRKYGLAS